MANERRKQFRGSGTAYRGGGDEWSSDVQKLLHQAPQFDALVKVAAGQEPELSRSQREFLKDFADRLSEAVAEGDEASSGTADVDERGKEAGESRGPVA